MNSRERMEAVLRGEAADRTPWAPELNDGFIRKSMNHKGIDPETVEELYLEGNRLVGGDTLENIVAVMPHFVVRYAEFDGDVVRKQIVENGDITDIIFETASGVLKQSEKADLSAGTTYITEHLLKDIEDFQPFLEIVESLEFKLDADAVSRKLAVIGDDGLLSLQAPETPIMSLIMYYMGLEKTLYTIADHPRAVMEACERMHEKYKEYYRALEGTPVQMVRPFEDTSSSLTSPGMYLEFAIPFLRDYAAICHEQGKLFVPHMCGLLNDMLPCLAEADLDGIEAITPPPTGDVQVSQVRNVLGSDCILIGGIDATRFVVEPNGVENLVVDVLESMRGDRRFMLGHEEVPRDASFEVVSAIPGIITRR